MRRGFRPKHKNKGTPKDAFYLIAAYSGPRAALHCKSAARQGAKSTEARGQRGSCAD